MQPAQKQALRKCRVHLVQHLDFKEIFDAIQASEIFTQLTIEDIKESNQSRADRVRAMLDYLSRRGPDAFDKFIQCLFSTGNQSHALHIIQAYRNALGPNEPIPEIYRNLPFPLQETTSGSGEQLSVEEAEQSEMTVELMEEDNGGTVNGRSVQETFGLNSPGPDMSTTTTSAQDTQLLGPGSSLGYSGHPDEEYRMESDPRGYLLIINNTTFRAPLANRNGSDVDCNKLKELFQALGFGVDIRKDLTGQGIKDCLLSLSQYPQLQHVDSLAVAILTHGGDDMLFGVDCHYITVNDALQYFSSETCPALHHKPKFFIVNACRGDSEDGGSIASSSSLSSLMLQDVHTIPDLQQVPGGTTRIPNLKDFLLAYSTIPGHVSWRHIQEGSWFIQALVKVFSEQARTTHVLDMLVKVNNSVAQNVSEEQRVQIPAPTFMLTKKWYLNPPNRATTI